MKHAHHDIPRIAVCTNFVSPYRRPVFRRLAEITGWDIRVLTNIDMEDDRAWSSPNCSDEPFHVHKCRSFARKRRSESCISQTQHIPFGIPEALLRFRPHAVISGELGVRTALSRATGHAFNFPVLPWTYDASPAAPRAVGGHIRRSLVLRSPAVIGMGVRARRVLEGYGCDPASIYDAPNAADVSAIVDRRNSSAHVSMVRQIRERFKQRRLAVVVGRMIKAKSIRLIIDAWEAIPHNDRKAWALVFVGDGPEREVANARTQSGICAVGSVSPNEAIDYLTVADLHIFGSTADPWGLVVNEAMHCGTPTLCSTAAGCCDDLIEHDTTGLTFSPRLGVKATAAAIARALQHPELPAIGSRARRHAAQFTPTRMAQGMASAVRAAIPHTTHLAMDIHS